MEDRLLKINEVILMAGISYNTLNNWYRFKRKFPDDEYAKILPDVIQDSPKATRYWKQSDVWKLIEFKSKVPHGRNGVMGTITQKYYKANTKEERNEKSI